MQVTTTERLTTPDLAALESLLIRNFDRYVAYSTPATQLSWARVTSHGKLVAAVPLVRLVKRPATAMLRSPLRKWLNPTLGPLAKKTTILVDTAFLAYDDGSPFCCLPDKPIQQVKLAVFEHLKKLKRIDTIWITEPESATAWATDVGFQQFYTLPMVQVDLQSHDNYAGYLASLSKKRRRNRKQEQKTFDEAGGTIECVASPFSPELAVELIRCLNRSAAQSEFTVPYNDVLLNPQAFAAQSQVALVAKVAGQVVGFMSFLQEGQRLMQCHGGLDYHRSHEVFAYHNLIAAAVEHAISSGAARLSMGPLNNETKRRAGSEFLPMVANLWNRNPVDALVAKKFFAKNFQVYRGEYPAAGK